MKRNTRGRFVVGFMALCILSIIWLLVRYSTITQWQIGTYKGQTYRVNRFSGVVEYQIDHVWRRAKIYIGFTFSDDKINENLNADSDFKELVKNYIEPEQPRQQDPGENQRKEKDENASSYKNEDSARGELKITRQAGTNNREDTYRLKEVLDQLEFMPRWETASSYDRKGRQQYWIRGLVYNRTDTRVKGPVHIYVEIVNITSGRRLRYRLVKANVDWSPRSETSFKILTTLRPPEASIESERMVASLPSSR